MLPGGTAGGDGLGYRLLTNEGVSGGDAGLALAVQGIGSALVLNAILWLALIVSVPVSGFNPIYATAAIVGALLLAAFAGLVLLLTRGEEKAAVIITKLVARLPFLKPGTAERTDRTVHEIANRAKIMLRDRALLRRAVFWASANWLLDAGSLFVFLLAFGHIENPDGLLVAYGLAYVLAAIPITPGGLGVVEGVLVPSLVGFGATRGAAIVAVIGYRLVNFWLPVPVGAGAYLSLRVAGDRKAATRRDDLRGAVEVAKSLGPLVRHPGPPVGLPPGAKRSPDAGPEAPADGRRPPGQGG